jgi:predicted DNA-binding transcriptional regulator YafY
VQQRSTSGRIDSRRVSVHRIFVERRRLVATCHDEARLAWFCLSDIISVSPEPETAFRFVSSLEIAQFLDHSVDGYHSGAAAIRCILRVRTLDAAWVRERLSASLLLHGEVHGEFTVFTTFTAGLLPFARLILGLGGVVRVETPELRQLVIELARSALAANA